MTDNTPEKIALELFWLIAETESKVVYNDEETHRRTLDADRMWILNAQILPGNGEVDRILETGCLTPRRVASRCFG